MLKASGMGALQTLPLGAVLATYVSRASPTDAGGGVRAVMLAGANLTRTVGCIVIGIVIGIVVGIARAGFAGGEAVVIELASVVVAG
ncbi:MAG TPA: hypothetical protein VGH89_15650 [Pseudonocardia sp.]|jgi:hypothetical protein